MIRTTLALALSLLLLAASGCGGAARTTTQTSSAGADQPAEPADDTAKETPTKPAQTPWRAAWLGLDATSNTCEGVFDYHPEGGMLIWYCHALSLVGWDQVLAEAPRPVFLSGPHTDGSLDTGSAASFGHYNPEFVKWAGRALIPGADDPAFRERTQGVYDGYARRIARIYWMAYAKLAATPSCLERELAAYLGAMKAGEGGYYERWFFFMNEAFCDRDPAHDDWFFDNGFDGGVPGNVVKGAVGFWLRRRIDGTDALFADALRRLLGAYDASWLARRS